MIRKREGDENVDVEKVGQSSIFFEKTFDVTARQNGRFARYLEDRKSVCTEPDGDLRSECGSQEPRNDLVERLVPRDGEALGRRQEVRVDLESFRHGRIVILRRASCQSRSSQTKRRESRLPPLDLNTIFRWGAWGDRETPTIKLRLSRGVP